MRMEKRLELGKRIQAVVKAASGQGESAVGFGDTLVDTTLIADILGQNFAQGSIYSRCKIYNVGENSNGLKIPIADTSTRTESGGVRGGVLSYWLNEADTKTASDAEFGQLNLGLNKLVVVIPTTDELLNDAPALAQFLHDSAIDAILYKVDRAILYGNGGSSINGIANSAVTIVVTATDPITIAEIEDMYHAYYGSPNGVWCMSKAAQEEVIDLDWTTQPNGYDFEVTEDAPFGRLYGLPILVTDVMSGDDIVLGDYSQFILAQKEVTQAVNSSLKFLEDEKYFRFVLRINGDVGWTSSMTLEDGSVVSPFVIKSDMDQSTSSSSSELYSSSSSSSEKYSSSSSSVDSSSSSSEKYSSSSSSSA